jgi:hypothetical protein
MPIGTTPKTPLHQETPGSEEKHTNTRLTFSTLAYYAARSSFALLLLLALTVLFFRVFPLLVLL